MKLTKESRDTREKIVRMKNKGMSARQIADALNGDGITTPNGLKWNEKKIYGVAYYMERTQGKAVKQARHLLNGQSDEETIETTSDNSDVLALLNSTKYTDTQKVQAVKALLS